LLPSLAGSSEQNKQPGLPHQSQALPKCCFLSGKNITRHDLRVRPVHNMEVQLVTVTGCVTVVGQKDRAITPAVKIDCAGLG
jgi:hypothetical protein